MGAERFQIRGTEHRETGEEIPFDAVEWFESATEQQIREFRSLGYRALCCDLIPDQIHCPGFEIAVSADDAEVWLAKHRPEVRR